MSLNLPRDPAQTAQIAPGSILPPPPEPMDPPHGVTTGVTTGVAAGVTAGVTAGATAGATTGAPTGATTGATANLRAGRAAGFASMRYAVITCAFLATVVAIYFARSLLFPVLSAMLLALLLAPAVAGLKRFRIPEAVGAAISKIGNFENDVSYPASPSDSIGIVTSHLEKSKTASAASPAGAPASGGDNSNINVAEVMRAQFQPCVYNVSPKDVCLYSLSVGAAAHNQTCDKQLCMLFCLS